MSKSKDRAPKEDKAEKKRKRQEENDDAPKKSKKSRKSEVEQDAPAADAPVVESKAVDVKAEKEEKKKRKKERKEKAAVEAAEENGVANGSEDFVPLVGDDVPMPDATDDSAAKSEKKKSKKDKKDKKDKSEKKEKKSKKSKDTSEADSAPSEEAVAEPKEVNGADSESKEDKKKAKKEKKEKKEKKSKKSKDEEEPAAETNGAEVAEDESAEADAQENGDENVEEGKKGRFIVFVGNLPYSATKESIAEHFVKLHPTDIRLRTYKGTEKFMGTCFLEFDRFDRMETCLKKYHHSVFPDGKKKEGRKINVELSAGGGGNSENRKSRIVAKNDKLHDERARDREKRAEVEMKQSERKEKKDAKGKKGGEAEEEAQPDNAGMHPARLAMMQAPSHRQRY